MAQGDFPLRHPISPVSGPAILKTIVPGTTVRFTMTERGHEDYAERLQPIKVSSHEAEPTETPRLTFLHRTPAPAAVAGQIAVGQQIPDSTLSDQAQRMTHFPQFKEKLVALTRRYQSNFKLN